MFALRSDTFKDYMIPSVYWSLDPRLNSERSIEWCNTLIQYDSCSGEDKKLISERRCSFLKSKDLIHLIRMWGNDLGCLHEWVLEACKRLEISDDSNSTQKILETLKTFQSRLPPEDKGFLSSESESDD